MEINRNQWFLAGLILLLLGIQFRMVDSFVLNPEATKVLAGSVSKNSSASLSMMGAASPATRKVIRPPDWIGWALLSAGSVFILHALAMRRPEG